MRPIEVLPSNPLQAQRALSTFGGLPKVLGMVEARAIGLPTLKGIVIDTALAKAAEALNAARQISERAYLVRHDRWLETDRHPQGGYIVPREALGSEVSWYASESRVLILLEPADPLDNLYSATVFTTLSGPARIEIVGPGFDASDLNRGNITPAESHDYAATSFGRLTRVASSYCNKQEFAISKILRLKKVALKFILRQRYFDIDGISEKEARSLIEKSPAFSKPQIQSLLGHFCYEAAPSAFVEKIESAMRKLIRFQAGSPTSSVLALSGSQINNGPVVNYWDIVRPDTKYRHAWRL